METMEELGVEVVLGERVKDEGKGEGVVTLSSGRVLPCDYLIDCTGQKPVSGILTDISPSSISPSGHIRVKPTMQLADDSLPNVYAAGDVADTDAQKANARSAMKQAKVAADNILLAIKGQQPRNRYKYVWQDGAILLTLGLHKAVVNISDDETEMNIHTKGKDMSLHAASGWKHMGVKPFDDDYEAEKTLDN
ncbi:hypothetical protein DIS24_g1869 [Lasiodiplodia hormozganensis]|uniref:FAD/NAD(P)-binding domain-containing protein n=1 Tax=Lasiodiplodia hormozganensis TaxID=869390 RepID=A0AA40D5P7_9PEZI|nr:hypothetical protein DIS24_g1869 [Lasiodiplodia hormozganensis]